MKRFRVTVELDIVEVTVSAKSKKEAKEKALERIGRRSINSLIRKSYPSNRKEIDVEEL